MPTFFIILIFTYLGGNAYIFYRGLQTLSGFPYGIKIFIDCFILASCTVLFRNDAKSQCEDTVLLIPHNV